MAKKPTRKEIEDAEREIDNLSRGGSGKGDVVARGLAQNRKDIDAEPLNTDPEPRDRR